MSFIERTSKFKIGFYCWKLFRIHQFNYYKVSQILSSDGKEEIRAKSANISSSRS